MPGGVRKHHGGVRAHNGLSAARAFRTSPTFHIVAKSHWTVQ